MRALAFCLMLPFAAPTAFGWGCDGHHMIALMARAQLTPAVSAAVDKILQADPVSATLNRFCKDRPADLLADVSTWADDVRAQTGNGDWHYVNIPRTLTKTPGNHDVTAWCGDPANEKLRCITVALESQLAALKKPGGTAAERGSALRYVIHLVEDLHQPLHDANNNDQGGNCTVVQFFGMQPPPNLHSVWDTRLIARDMAQRNLRATAYTVGLAAEFAGQQKAWSQKGFDPERWAWEAHSVAVKLSYGMLGSKVPTEAPGTTNCDAKREKTAAQNIVIGDDYFRRAMPAVREQMAKSAARLAALLNASL